MKEIQINCAGSTKQLICDVCQRRFYKLSQLGQHKLSAHSDTWAVLDLLEAGLDEDEAQRRYEKCISENCKSMGRKEQSVIKPGFQLFY